MKRVFVKINFDLRIEFKLIQFLFVTQVNMSSETSQPWSIQASKIINGQQLHFVVECEGNRPRTAVVSTTKLLDYVTLAAALDWVITDSRGECFSLEDYEEYLKEYNIKDRTQLFLGKIKLFGCSWRSLRQIFQSFRHCNFVESCDILKVRRNNNHAVEPDINNYDPHLVSIGFGAALDGDWSSIMELKCDWTKFDAVFELAESLGIQRQYWSPIEGEEYVSARMNLTFKQLMKVATVPGMVKSSVLRESILNVTDYLQMQVTEIVDECGLVLDKVSDCVLPSTKKLMEWIKEGLIKLEIDDNNQIIFGKFKGPQLLKCLKLLPSTFILTADVGIQAGAQALIRELRCGQKKSGISEDIYEVWSKICGLVTKIIGNDEVLACGIPAMCVLYYLTIHDENYKDWEKVFSFLMKSPLYGTKWCFKFLVADVLKVDIQHSNFDNLGNKNELILQGIRQMIRVVGKEQFFMITNISFIKDVMNWLYGINANDEAKVSEEILYNIDQISNLSARFAIIMQVFRYYCFECTRPLPDRLKLMFVQYLPIPL